MSLENLGMSLEGMKGNDFILYLLGQWFVIVAAAFAAGELARRLKQPRAVGWIAAGLFLGPSGLGNLWPAAFELLFRPSEFGIASSAMTKVLDLVRYGIAEFGLLLLLFITGVEFNFGHLKQKGKAAGAISLAGIAFPFGLGILIAPLLLQATGETVPALGFSLFLGTCLSITALPILGNMMMELGITRTRLGAITISAGAMDDAVGWIGLAAVTALVKSQYDVWRTIGMVGATIVFAAVMVLVVKPLLSPWLKKKLEQTNGHLDIPLLAVVFLLILTSGIITQAIGIFALFGAFLAGAILSDVPRLREATERSLQGITTVILLPVFFTYTGLQTDISNLGSLELWLMCGLVVGVAIVGKLGGCYIAARGTGSTHKEALCVGTMMNCRALMELIAANIGMALGVVPGSVYCMLVFTALLTTVMTTPLLLRFMPGTELEGPIRASGFLRTPRKPRATAEDRQFVAQAVS